MELTLVLFNRILVQLYIFLSVVNSSLHQLKPKDLFGMTAEADTYGSCSAADIEHNSLLADVKEGCNLIEHFLEHISIDLEESKRTDRELESVQVLSIKCRLPSDEITLVPLSIPPSNLIREDHRDRLD